MIFVLLIIEPFFCDASYNQIGKLGTLMVHVGVCNGGRDTCIHVPLCTILLPLPTTTPTPSNTYHYPYSSPYLLPWALPAFLEEWSQDRVRGRHLTAKYYYRGVVCFRPIQWGSMAPPGDAHGLLPLLLPIPTTTYSSPYLLLPLLLLLPTTTPTPPLTYHYPYSSPYLLLPLPLPIPTTTPTTIPTPPLTYHYPYSSPYLLLPLPLPIPTTTPTTIPTTTPTPTPTPYLLPWAPPAFLEGLGQDRVRGRHLTAKYYYRGVVRFRPIQSGGGGGGGGCTCC